MKHTTIAAALAGLTGAAPSFACDKTTSPATEVPASTETPEKQPGEHACGNHAEGACAGDANGGGEPADAPTARAFEIAPGKFAEANFQMTKGSKVAVTFSKGSPDIAWDVHSHDHAGGTKIHDQGNGGAGTIEFVAPEDGVFSVLWKNAGASATALDATVTLGDGATIHSWMPAE
jgi:hypothetical protein